MKDFTLKVVHRLKKQCWVITDENSNFYGAYISRKEAEKALKELRLMEVR